MTQQGRFTEESLETQKPTVSIITPCFNAEQTIEKTVNSVISQAFKDWELILVDDQSTDNTYERAQRLAAKDNRIKLSQLEANGGAAKARNRGIELAQGRFIAFIDADDEWATSKLSTQIEWMINEGAALTYTAYSKTNQEGIRLNLVGVPDKVSYRDLLKTNYIGCSTAIYDTDLVGKVYMPDIRRRQDYGLWLRILKLTPEARGLNVPLTNYLVHDHSLSSNKRVSSTYNWKIYREIENLPLVVSAYYFLQYAIRGVLRTRAPRLAATLRLLQRTNTENHTVD